MMGSVDRVNFRDRMEWCSKPKEGEISFDELLAEAKVSNRGAVVRSETLGGQLRRDDRLEDDGQVRGKAPSGSSVRALKVREVFAATDDFDDDEELVEKPVAKKVTTEGLSGDELAALGKELLKNPRKSEDEVIDVEEDHIETIVEDDDDAILAEPPPWRRERQAKTQTFQSAADARPPETTSFVSSTIDAVKGLWANLTASDEPPPPPSHHQQPQKKKKKKKKTSFQY